MTGIVLFALKLTILLLLGASAAALLRKRSAAARHFVWAATLASALLLPLVANLAPAMKVPVAQETPLIRPAATFSPQAGRRALAAPTASAPLPAARGEGARRAGEGLPLLAILYAVGAGAMLLWLALGHLAVRRIARDAMTADGDDWDALIAEARERIHVRKSVRVALSERAAAPFTAGWLAPVVLLPLEAATWPAERKRAALLHELAHVARNDAPVHVVARLACALYWPHPAVWLALRRLRREGEQATDDRVIARAMIAPEYAAQLVDVARAARTRGVAALAAVSMACPSHLETRLRALLDETRRRGPLSRRLAAAAIALVALILVPLAAARPEARTVTRTAARAEARTATRVVTYSDARADAGPEARAETRGEARPRAQTKGTYEYAGDARPGGRLVLDLETGADVTIRGGDGERVEVHARLDGAPSVFDANTNGDEVRVTSRFERTSGRTWSSHELTVRVPRQFDVHLSSSGGALTIRDLAGTFEGSTGGGSIDLARVHGTARLSTGGGDILVTDSELNGRVSTGGGTVKFDGVRGGLRGHTSGGAVVRADEPVAAVEAVQPVEATEPVVAVEPAKPTESVVSVYADEGRVHTAPARVLRSGVIAISQGGGAVDLEEAPHGAVISTGGGRIVVGRARGEVDAGTGGGMIRVGPVYGSVRASTGGGSVSVTIADDGGREAHNVDVTTGSGNVEIVLPASFDGRFDIETAYTESHDPVSIRSDFDLRQEPVTELSSRDGTPRRYVRASGSVGGGRDRVRVHAVNGNVRIRRE